MPIRKKELVAANRYRKMRVYSIIAVDKRILNYIISELTRFNAKLN